MTQRIFVIAPPFHGATLLSILLDNHPGVVALGDTLPILEHLDYRCACGVQIKDCNFWCEALNAAGPQLPSLGHMIPVYPPRLSRPWLGVLCRRQPSLQSTILIRLVNLLSRSWRRRNLSLHRLAATRRGAAAVVDGAKNPVRAVLLGSRLRRDSVWFLHLVRDPRAYVRSCQRNYDDSSGASATDYARAWLDFHAYVEDAVAARWPDRYLRVRYEDLCSDPATETQRLLSVMGLPPADLVRPPRPDCHVIGNRMLATFDGTITPDRRFMTDLDPRLQHELLAVSRPLSAAYGYTTSSPLPNGLRS